MDPLFPQWGARQAALTQAMTVWRGAHPRATLTEIERALDAELQRLRAQMLTDLAQTSPLADLRRSDPATRPRCPTCSRRLQARGCATRHLQTSGGVDLPLTRSYAACPVCPGGLFPPR